MTWAEATDAAWPGRMLFASAVFHDSMWVLGGWQGLLGPHYVLNDVWCSADGANWVQKPDAKWSIRTNHRAVATEEYLWVLGGGASGGHEYNDVWRSTNGTEWDRVCKHAGWCDRWNHTALAYKDKVWVLGGRFGYGKKYTALNDVWYSADGKHWICATDSAAWFPRASHASVVFKGKMWVLGGYNAFADSLMNDVWYSTNGRTWTCATPSAPWSARDGLSVAVLRDTMWLCGGWPLEEFANDVWYSTDGVNWELATESADWSPRTYHEGLATTDRIWVMGGWVGPDYPDVAQDVWCSYGLGGVLMASVPGTRTQPRCAATAGGVTPNEFCPRAPAPRTSISGGAGAGTAQMPTTFALSVEPNPMRLSTTVNYAVPVAAKLSLKLYDITGTLAKTVASGRMEPGRYTADLSAKGLARGVYFLKLASDAGSLTRKVVIQ
jgi:hypothetical protein